MGQRRLRSGAALLGLLILLSGEASGVYGQLPPGASASLAAHRHTPENLSGQWVNECVDPARNLGELGDRHLALDGAGHPHLAYGGNSLYYAWHDGTAWHIETVDDSPGTGASASLALDAAGNPHISYFDGTNHDLKYANFDGNAWRIETVDGAGEVGWNSSLALDASGAPHISYYDATYQALRYAHLEGAAWQTATVAISASQWIASSLGVDGAGHPHIVYDGGTPAGLQHIWYDGSAWHNEYIGSGDVPALAMDSAGRPHVAYLNFSLAYAYYDGTAWITTTVSPLGSGLVGRVSLALDSAGRPAISYHDTGYDRLGYAWYDGTAWFTTTVDASVGTGIYNAVAVDAAGRPAISYSDAGYSIGHLKYVRFDGTAWQIETVDRSRAVNQSSLQLDAAGHARVAYEEPRQGELLYAHYDGTAWHTATVDGAANAGQGDVSLALDSSGLPHISYCQYPLEQLCNTLKYASFDGTAWHTETVESGWRMGQHTSLALDSADHPHISYYDYPNSTLKYAHYDGTAWHIIALGGGGQYHALALDAAGRPHIASGYTLTYASYDGTAWSFETVDSEAQACRVDLALDAAGHPHILYFDEFNALKYAFFDGTSWSIETVETIFAECLAGSLALDAAGRPHITYAYQDLLSYNEYFKYAWRTDGRWESEVIDPTPGAGGWNSLALDSSGLPHVSYQRNGQLRYAYLVPWSHHGYLPVVAK
jgi:hypothetical protein